MKNFVSLQTAPFMCRIGILICLIALSTRSDAAIITWTGAVSANWMVAANWSPQTLPGANDQALIVDSANDPVLPGGNTVTVKSLIVQPGGKLTLQFAAALIVTYDFPITFQNEGEINNFGFIDIQQTISIGTTMINDGIINNEYFAVLMIEGAEGSNIYNYQNGVFNNRGTITAFGSAYIGINNAGMFHNDPSGFISIDNIEDSGITNFTQATFINQGKIWLGNYVGTYAITNYGNFQNAGCNSLIRVNSPSPINGYSNTTGTFLNEGSIVENSNGNSRITTNTGVIQNLGGGNFVVGSNTGYITQSPECIWTGCNDSGWNNSLNWHNGDLPAASKDVVLTKGNHQPVMGVTLEQARTLDVRPGVTLMIGAGGILEITGPGTNGILSDGAVRNAGQIHVGTTGAFSNTGILNRHEFVNLPAGTVTVNKTVQTAIQNSEQDTFINAGAIRIGHQDNAGATGLLNRGELENSGDIFIDRITGTGLLNEQHFTNLGHITFGSVGAAGATALENRGQFFNKDIIDFRPALVTVTEIAQTAGAFTNERCAQIILKKRIELHAGLLNQGLIQVGAATTSSSAAPQLLNTGIIAYAAANYIPNTVNQGIIIRPMPEGQCNVFSDALEVDDLNGFVVNGSWYRNPPLNQLGGSYSTQANTLTTIGIPTGIASNYYFTISDPECGKTYTFQTSGTMPVDVTPPQVVCPANQTVQLPGTYTIASPVSDNCPSLSYWSAAFSGNTNGNPADFPAISYGLDPGPIAFQPGTTTVTLGAMDGSNQAQTCTFTITVATVLPLELSRFQGQKLPGGNRLEWTTATEKNVAWHILERSAEGLHWTEIARRQGQINSASLQHYEAFDPTPFARTYYRLRSTDMDGSAQVSHIIQLEREGRSARIEAVYPVPFEDQLTLRFSTDREQSFQCRVLDEAGRVVAKQIFAATAGADQTYTFALRHLPAGMYSVVLESEVVRVVKE